MAKPKFDANGNPLNSPARHIMKQRDPEYRERLEREDREARMAAIRRDAERQAALPRWRRVAQAELRKAGYTREHTSDSGSSYYRKGKVVIRISDHPVQQTPERENGGFSWATSLNQIILTDYQNEDEVREAARSFIDDDE